VSGSHAGQLVLVTGATGYIGGRLVPRLLEAGHRVRCLVRDLARLQGRSWLVQVDVARGDVFDRCPPPRSHPTSAETCRIANVLAGGDGDSRPCSRDGRSATISSAHDWNRASGDFRSSRMMMSESGRGTSRRYAKPFGGLSWRIACSVSTRCSRAKARVPVSISNSTAQMGGQTCSRSVTGRGFVRFFAVGARIPASQPAHP